MLPIQANSSALRILRDLNTDDVLRAVGLGHLVGKPSAVRRLLDAPSSLLAQKLLRFDAALGRGEWSAAGAGLLAELGTRLRFAGSVPVDQGPRLFLANHPGLGDVPALMTLLGTPDLKIVARDRPVLRALPGLLPRLLLVSERGAGDTVRRAEAHLAAGGALLTFPAGQIEPDPAWQDPSASWARWSASTAFWARRVPGLTVQPFLVSGVRARPFVDPWFARWRPWSEREWTAAVAQLVVQLFWKRPRTARITVWGGEPIPGERFNGAALLPSLAALAALSRR